MNHFAPSSSHKAFYVNCAGLQIKLATSELAHCTSLPSPFLMPMTKSYMTAGLCFSDVHVIEDHSPHASSAGLTRSWQVVGICIVI